MLRHVHIVDNRAEFGGGVSAESDLTIEDSLIADNRVDAGGGIAGRVNIIRTIIDGNRSDGDGAEFWGQPLSAIARLAITARGGLGGGLAIKTLWTGVINTTISGNYAERGGGGIHGNDDASGPIFDSTTIVNNSVGLEGSGGGFLTEDGGRSA